MEQLRKNIKYYRRKAKLTQTDLGNAIGTGTKSVSNWETGFNLPPLEYIIKISKLFGISIDTLLGFQPRQVEKIKSKNLFVPIAAQAGYLEEWTEESFSNELEAIYIPGVPPDRESRTFEVSGSSMTPLIFAGDLVVCVKVERNTEFHGDDIYVIVTRTQGILVKHIELVEENQQLRLISSNNAEFRDTYVDLDNIREIWHARLKVTRHLTSIALPQKDDDLTRRLHRLEQLFLDKLPKPE